MILTNDLLINHTYIQQETNNNHYNKTRKQIVVVPFDSSATLNYRSWLRNKILRNETKISRN